MKKIAFILFAAFFANISFGQSKYTTTEILAPKKALRFIAFGDWGRDGEYNQKEVAVELGVVAKAFKPSFIVSTGDNFYPRGVRSTQDYAWIASYESIYTAHSLQCDWYVVLGNHDYGGNVQAEIDYSNVSRRWNMPARYYSRKVAINGDSTKKVLMVFLDTTPFLSEYYENDEHAVKSVDTAAQRAWIERTLADADPNIKWKLVFGHHPLYTGGGRMNAQETKELNTLLKPIFDRNKVDAYICGHEHNLQYIKPQGTTHYFVTGAGSETTKVIVHPDGGKFALSENGFMDFSVTPSSIQVQVFTYTGKMVYATIISK